MRSAVLCLTLFVGGSIAWARPAPQTPLAVASKAMADGDFEKALATLDAALPKTSDAAEAARMQLARGECLIALGKRDKAALAFKAALAKDPSIEPDRKRASPDVVEFFESTRATVPGVVSITVKNGEATVRVDDRSMGPAPLSLELTAGAHRVSAQASDGKTASATIDVAAARKLQVDLELRAPTPEPKAEPVAEAPKPAGESAVPPPPPPPQVEAKSGSSLRTPGWVALGGGVVVGGAGAVLLVRANQRYSTLTGPGPIDVKTANAAVSDGNLFQPLGWAGIGLGAAAIAAGVLMLLLPGSDAPSVSALVLPDGTAWVSVGGRFPW